MNIRLAKYKANRLAGMNQYNAARAAGYSESTARTRNHDIENSIKLDIAASFEQAGYTAKYRAEALIALTTATKIQNVNIILKKNEDGKLEVQDTDDFIEVPDNNARIQAHRLINELLGVGKVAAPGAAGSSVETFLVELLKTRSKELAVGEGFRITHTENRELNEFVQK